MRFIILLASALLRVAASQTCECPTVPTNLSLYDALLIGDDVAAAYAPVVDEVLAYGNLSRVVKMGAVGGGGACAGSFGVLACVPGWLAVDWAVVHVAVGLADLAADVSTATYAARLAALHGVLGNRTNATVFATTTPAPPSSAILDGVAAYNAALRSLFGAGGAHANVRVDDLYGVVVDNCRKALGSACYPKTCGCPRLQGSSATAWTARGRRVLGLAVAAEVVAFHASVGSEADTSNIVEDAADSSGDGVSSWKLAWILDAGFIIFLEALMIVAIRCAACDTRLQRHLTRIVRALAGDVPPRRGVLRVAAGLLLLFFVFSAVVLAVHYGAESTESQVDCAPQCPAVPWNASAYDALLIGDSVSGQYSDAVAELLKRQELATVLRMDEYGGSGFCGTSYGLLACVDAWLGASNWTTVHVNWGLHDIDTWSYAYASTGAAKGDSTSLQRESSARARCKRKHPRFESAPRDDRSSKNKPKRVENGRDMSL